MQKIHIADRHGPTGKKFPVGKSKKDSIWPSAGDGVLQIPVLMPAAKSLLDRRRCTSTLWDDFNNALQMTGP